MTAAAHDVVLGALARRLEEDPEHVLPVLRVIAGTDTVVDQDDKDTVERARALNVARLAERRKQFAASSYTTKQVRDLLGGVTRQAVASRVANGSLLADEVRGGSCFPDWQFGPSGTRPRLRDVLTLLTDSGRDALGADAVMRQPWPEEGGRSLADLYASGETDRVLAHLAALPTDD